MRAEVASLPEGLGETTQFEVLTVAALLAFAESGVEAVASRPGWAGAWTRPTSRAPVVVLTNIALEHTEVLGDTRELIFAEKAAVIKGGDAVFGELDGLEDEARRACAAAGATPHFLRAAASPGDFAVGAPDDFAVTLRAGGAAERWAGLRVPTPALYQVENAALAVAAVRLLLGGLDEAAARQALPAPRSPAGCSWSASVRWCWPTAPTTRTACACSRRASPAVRVPRPAVGVLAIMRDKATRRCSPASAAARPRGVHAGERAAQPHRRRSSPRRSRDAAARPRAAAAPPVRVPDPHAALARARELAGAGGTVLVGGSLFLLEDLAGRARRGGP